MHMIWAFVNVRSFLYLPKSTQNWHILCFHQYNTTPTRNAPPYDTINAFNQRG